MADEDVREGESSRPTKKQRVHVPQKYLAKYKEQWPCLQPSKTPHHAFCTVCNCDVDISHQGAADCRRHVEGKKHQKIVASLDTVPKIQTFFHQASDLRPIRAETMFTTFIVEHNLPLSAADHAGPLFKKMFPDSDIAKQYGCARTKTAAIVKTLAKNDADCITEIMKRSPYSLATDGSTDMEDIKMYPIVVKSFDPSLGRVTVMLLKICESRESTGKAIFELMDSELKKRGIPWENCVSFAADNAAVMQGLGKGVAAFLKTQGPHIYLVGCACHLIHLAAERASRQLNVNIEDFLITIYYYLDKSSKRKSSLRDIQIMCDADVRKILKMSSTRWLSLGQCVNRLLQQWDNLTLFFENEVTGKKKKTAPSKLLKAQSGLTHESKAALPSTSKPAVQPKVSPELPPLPSGPICPDGSGGIDTPMPPLHTHITQPVAKPTPSTSTVQPKVSSIPPKLPSPPPGSTQRPVAKPTPSASTVQPKISSSVPPKLPTPPPGSTQRPDATLTSTSKTPARPAAEFDLTRFLFQQNEIRKRAVNDKKKRNKKEEGTDMTKPERVYQFLTNPMSKVYALFLKRAIPIFDISNQILQKEEPCIQILLPTLELQLQKVLLSFCKPEHVITMMDEVGTGIKPTLYSRRGNQLPDEELSIGQDTLSFIQSQGNLDLNPFFRDVRKFFSSAAEYMVSKFPFGDELLMHAVVADITKRQSVKFASLRFFISRFPSLLPEKVTVDQVEDEFRMYQTSSFDDIILKKRTDKAWVDIGRLKTAGQEIFSNLSAVMLGILVIFHSNADCERIFSLVTKNKTQYRASLSTDMISALVTRKVSMAAKGTVCHMEGYTEALLKKAKSATYEEKLLRASSVQVLE